MNDDVLALRQGGSGAISYGEAVSVYMALAVDKLADYSNSICTWNPTNQNISHLFTKQVIPMAWDFPEASPITGGLSFDAICGSIAKTVEKLPTNSNGIAFQQDCSTIVINDNPPIISTDPPYYDNIAYADLSDFFYIWLRRSLITIYPDLFSTLDVPKADELVAIQHRHGNKQKAEEFFLERMTRAMQRLATQAHPDYPVTIYYAYKQSEKQEDGGVISTGWETFLEAIIHAGFELSGTWPIRTEREARSIGMGTNALASSIVLVCRKRSIDTNAISRSEFVKIFKVRTSNCPRILTEWKHSSC